MENQPLRLRKKHKKNTITGISLNISSIKNVKLLITEYLSADSC
jgi:hypothetical protein